MPQADHDSATDPVEAPRIEVISAELADQIAAGEVVERPASVVKELVENAIDAGASRVEVELQGAGLDRIVVRDDGRGVHPDDLTLCIKRHATSKVRRLSDLVEVATLGFRGEALASIAAVAHLTIDSRTPEAKTGTRLHSRPGLPPELEPVGTALGTRIDVQNLFGNVPARRKFMRSDATEVGHCSDTMLRLAVSSPHVHLRLVHGTRELLDLPGAELPRRIAMILERKTQCALSRLEGQFDGVGVLAYLAPPTAAQRGRGGLFLVVRRRVVAERTLSKIVHAAYRDSLPSGRHPLGAVLVDPPHGTVDVNVHPQKAEVRFSDPQRVYAAVRKCLEDYEPESSASSPAASASFTTAATRSLQDWDRATPGPSRPADTYRLRTRATRDDYSQTRAELRREAQQLTTPTAAGREAPARVDTPAAAEVAAAPMEAEVPTGPSVTLLTCLPGPVAVLRIDDDLLAIDMLELRSHLVYRRLREDLGGSGRVVAQGLLSPIVVRCDADDLQLCVEGSEALAEVGMVVEPFGDEALLVRAVPAGLRSCVDEPDVEDLVHRIVPWLRTRGESGRASQSALEAMAGTRGSDPAPRLARRWVRELLDEGVDLETVPGIVRFTAQELRK